MQTNLVQQFANTKEGQEAESILRACVHCGFCTATCPTYQELNDERDGPRGRIYLMKMFLEGAEVTEKTREHLDRSPPGACALRGPVAHLARSGPRP